MPTFTPRSGGTAALLVASLLLATSAGAQDAQPAPAAPEKFENSAMNAPLFQQLLIGEIEFREGDLAAAYQLVLDAARRTKDERLFRRATDIALQGRAGDEALQAVKAWRLAAPESVDALRYPVQLLVQLNRSAEVAAPLQELFRGSRA